MAKRRSSGPPAQPPIPNRLLASLPPDEYRRLVPHLEPYPLILKQVLYKPGEVADFVYFPAGGFVSVVTVLANGDMVEVATIGNEGMVGGSAVIAGYREPTLTMVQMASEACDRMPAAAVPPRNRAARRAPRRGRAILPGADRRHHAVDRVQRDAQRRAAAGAVAADRARSRREGSVPADAGVPGDDARRGPPHGDHRRRRASARRADHVSPRPDLDPRVARRSSMHRASATR